MMPGENHSKIAGIASDATAGACQNCTALQQSVNEYVSALLSLKQKVIDTDHLLTEYEEKCDELQRCQRESNELHQQLDELLDKMVPLEKRSQEYEAMQSELEEKRSALKLFEQRSLEMDILREESSKTMSLNMNLESQLRKLEEMSSKQIDECDKLKMEKESLERELQKTQSSLQLCRQTAAEADRLRVENTKTLALKENLEIQLRMVKDSSVKQMCEMAQLKLDKDVLERRLREAEKNVEKLEREIQKDVRNMSAQTNPIEPAVDKDKVKLLLEELWKCVDSQSPETSQPLYFTAIADDKVSPAYSSPPEPRGSPLKVPNGGTPPKGPRSEMPHSLRTSVVGLIANNTRMEAGDTSKRDRNLGEPLAAPVGMDEDPRIPTDEHTSVRQGPPSPVKETRMDKDVSRVEEILDWFKALPSLLSPISSPFVKEAIFRSIPDSSDDEEEAKSAETGTPFPSNDLPSVKPKSTDLTNVSVSFQRQAVEPISPSKEAVIGASVKSSRSPSAKESIPRGKDFDLSGPVEHGNLETSSNGKDMMLEKTWLQDDGMDAVGGRGEAPLAATPDGHTAEDRKGKRAFPTSASESQLQYAGQANNKECMSSDSSEDIVMELQTPLDVCDVTREPLVDVSMQQTPCDEMEVERHTNETTENSKGECDKPVKKGVIKVTKLTGSETPLEDCMQQNESGLGLAEVCSPDSVLANAALLSRGAMDQVQEGNSFQQIPTFPAAREISQQSGAPLNKKHTPDNEFGHGEICNESRMSQSDVPEMESAERDNWKTNEQLADVHKSSSGLKSHVISGSSEISARESDASCMLASSNGVVSSNTDSPALQKSVKTTSEHLISSSESSDESFQPHRKVKTLQQRTDSQMSSRKAKDLGQTLLGTLDDDWEAAHVKHLNHSVSDEPAKPGTDSLANLESEIKETKSDQKNRDVKVGHTETHQEIDDSESLEGVKLFGQKNLDEVSLQEETEDRSSLTTVGPECILVPESFCPPNFQNIHQEADMSKTDDKAWSRKCENTNKTLPAEDRGEFSANTTQTGASEDCVIPSRMSRGSASVQAGMKGSVTDEESVIAGSLELPAAEPPSFARSPECIRKVRSEMGPPLPPLLQPLTATPTKPRGHDSPSSFIPGKLSFSSPKNELSSHQNGKVVPPIASPLTDGAKEKSPSLAPQSPSERSLSSPLQFCSATPKHAVPVPGRFPPSALSSSAASTAATQENSVRILDTMYPELSARARTLNILRGNVSLGRPAGENGKAAPVPVSQITGYKSINSSSTAFTKTGKSYEPDNGSAEESAESLDAPSLGCASSCEETRKRPKVSVHLPASAKRLRLEDGSAASPGITAPVQPLGEQDQILQIPSQAAKDSLQPECPQDVSAPNSTAETISRALTKIGTSCFDLLPVVRCRLSIGKNSTVPVLRDEEREVIHEFCEVHKSLAEDFLSAVLSKMKNEKNTLSGDQLQALCRVYTGICRQKEEGERVHLLTYCILKEDFPDSAKLILFIVTTWYNILLPHAGVVCNAMHAVIKERAHGEVLQCLSKYLGWETNPPCDTEKMITKMLIPVQMGVNMKFQHYERHGDDLNHAAWEYVFALDLLCSQKKWNWTYENLISKELWPIMNKWVTQPRNQPSCLPDVSVATVLRLIGRLGQLGIKERSIVSVRNVAKVINTFGRHGKTEGVPWAVQLATIYTIYDLSPSNPKEAMETLAAWRGETVQAVPSAVMSCITQVGSICRQVKL